MKRILSLSLVICMILTLLSLTACKKTVPPDGDESKVPSDPAEALLAVTRETAKQFLSETQKENFDSSNGTKTTFVFDATVLARTKLEADIITSSKDGYFFSVDLNKLTFAATNYEGLRFCITNNEVIAGFDSLLSRNFGVKFSEAEKQITDFVKRLFPTTPPTEITAIVKTYLEEFKQSFNFSEPSQSLTVSDELKNEIRDLVKENIKFEFVNTEEANAIQVSFDLRNMLDIVEGTVRILSRDKAWENFFSSIDSSLRDSISENVSIPEGVTALEYYLNELESSLANIGCTPADIKLIATVDFSSETLLISDIATVLYVKEQSAVSLNVIVTYEDAPTLTLSEKSFKNDIIGIEKEEDLLDITYKASAKDSESEGFSLTIANKTAKKNAKSEDDKTYEEITINYTKDLTTNEYDFKLFGKEVGDNKFSKLLTVAGRSYTTKTESFFSIEEIGSSTIGVTIMVDISLKTTAPTEADLEIPKYDGLDTITDEEINILKKFIEALFPSDDSSNNGIFG